MSPSLLVGGGNMSIFKLVKANIKSKKDSFAGIMILIAIITCLLATIISINVCVEHQLDRAVKTANIGDMVYINTTASLNEEMMNKLMNIEEVDYIMRIESTSCNQFTANGKNHRSSVFFQAYEPDKQKYSFFDKEDSLQKPAKGEIYMPLCMASTLDCKVGDEVTVTSDLGDQTYKIARLFEEPFLGANAIGYKIILMNQDDLTEMRNHQDIDTDCQLEMVHVYLTEQAKKLSTSEQSKIFDKINKETQILSSCNTSLSLAATKEFTLMMNNILSVIITGFSVFLLLVVFIVISHSIGTSIEMEYVNFGILKSQGFTNALIRLSLVLQYLIAGIFGAVLGLIVSGFVTDALGNEFESVTGLVWKGNIQIGYSLLALFAIFLLLVGFAFLKTRRISKISPVQAISLGREPVYFQSRMDLCIDHMGKLPLGLRLVIKSVLSKGKEYIGTIIIVILLTTFTIMATSMNQITDKNNMFSMMGMLDSDIEIRAEDSSLLTQEVKDKVCGIIEEETTITKQFLTTNSYFVVDGTQFLGRVIDKAEGVLEPALEGKNPEFENEIAITDVMSDEIGKGIGDVVVIDYNNVQKEFLIVGICKFMNDMGRNFTILLNSVNIMNPEFGINDIEYCIKDTGKIPVVISKLEEEFKGYHGNVTITNTRKENDKQIDMIKNSILGITMGIYVISLVFIAIIIGMTSRKSFLREKVDLGIYKSVGFTTKSLRLQFSCRFVMVTVIGTVLGALVNILTNDWVMSKMLYNIGITRFHTNYSFENVLVSIIWIVLCTFVFAWISSRKIGKVSCKLLIQE